MQLNAPSHLLRRRDCLCLIVCIWVLGLLAARVVFPDPTHNRKFDVHLWRTGNRAIRTEMSGSLLQEPILKSGTKKQVLELLGEPNRFHDFRANDLMIDKSYLVAEVDGICEYDLGEAANIVVCIVFENNRVSEAYLRTY